MVLTCVLLEGLGELVDGGGHLQSLHEDSLLTLDTDVARPSDKAGKVALGLDISSKTEVASILLEERTRAGAGTTSASLGLDDLLSLSFLHLLGTTKGGLRITLNHCTSGANTTTSTKVCATHRTHSATQGVE